jgi:Na+-transporting methylmalonyl-CoA/oxaloacetate decarboxylase gamma subunit
VTALRRLSVLLGGLCFASGGLLWLRPELADGLPVDALVSWLGHDYFLAAAVGGVALVLGLLVVVVRALSGFEQASPPETESVPRGRPLGEAVDRVVDGDLGVREALLGETRRQVRGRLRRAAVGVLVRTDGCSRQRARQRVASGDWGSDDAVATYLATDPGSDSLWGRLRDAVPGPSRFSRRTRRTVTAIVDRDATGRDA